MSAVGASASEVDLAEANVRHVIVRQAVPMAAALLLISLSLIVDTYFVAKLGAKALDAVGFASPIITLCVSGANGFSRGITVLVSQTLGRGDRAEAARVTTCALLFVAAAGLVLLPLLALFRRWLFVALGAPAALWPEISKYLLPYLGAACILTAVFAATAALRGTGDARQPAIVLALGAVLQVVLAPLFILGVGPLSGLGLLGAGLANGCAYAAALLVVLIALKRKSLLTRALESLAATLRRWKGLLQVSLVTTLSNVLFPLSTAAITAIVATYGAEYVAGFAVGVRFQRVVGIVTLSLGAAVVPMVGYNLAGRRFSRVSETVGHATLYAAAWGLLNWAVMGLLARPLATTFTHEEAAISTLVSFLQIASAGMAAHCVLNVSTSALVALGKLRQSMLLSVLSTAGAIPAAAIGSALGGITGLFIGMSATALAMGVVGWLSLRIILSELVNGAAASAAVAGPRAPV